MLRWKPRRLVLPGTSRFTSSPFRSAALATQHRLASSLSSSSPPPTTTLPTAGRTRATYLSSHRDALARRAFSSNNGGKKKKSSKWSKFAVTREGPARDDVSPLRLKGLPANMTGRDQRNSDGSHKGFNWNRHATIVGLISFCAAWCGAIFSSTSTVPVLLDDMDEYMSALWSSDAEKVRGLLDALGKASHHNDELKRRIAANPEWLAQILKRCRVDAITPPTLAAQAAKVIENVSLAAVCDYTPPSTPHVVEETHAHIQSVAVRTDVDVLGAMLKPGR
jgi:hypothetical protein